MQYSKKWAFVPSIALLSKQGGYIYVPHAWNARETQPIGGAPWWKNPASQLQPEAKSMGERGQSPPWLPAGLFPGLLQGEAEREKALLQSLLPEDSTIRGLNDMLFQVSGSRHLKCQSYGPFPSNPDPQIVLTTVNSWGGNTNSSWDITKRITFWERISSFSISWYRMHSWQVTEGIRTTTG